MRTVRAQFHLLYKDKRHGERTMCGAEQTKYDRSYKVSDRYHDVRVKGGIVRFLPCQQCMIERHYLNEMPDNDRRMLWG